MKKLITTLVLLLAVAACSSNQSGSTSDLNPVNLSNGNTGITSLQGTNVSDRDNYDQEANFCDNILFHKTEARVLIDYNFFPQGADVCQQATYDAELNPASLCRTEKTVVLPCGFEGTDEAVDSLLAVDISAPVGGESCSEHLVLDVSSAEFTVDGLVFPFSSSLDVFANSLGFRITREGIVDVSNGALLSFESKDFGMEEIVSEIQ